MDAMSPPTDRTKSTGTVVDGAKAPPTRGAIVAEVMERLREAILSGQLSPGERIRQGEVAERFGTSRMPVRDALRHLESEGLVTLVANAGARVADLNLAELSEVYEMRERLEPWALRITVPLLGDEDVIEMRALAAAMEHANRKQDASAWVDLDRRFHLRALSKASKRLLRVIGGLWNSTQQYRRSYFFLPDRIRIAHIEHGLLLDAIESGAEESAERILLLHIGRTRQTLIRHLNADAEDEEQLSTRWTKSEDHFRSAADN